MTSATKSHSPQTPLSANQARWFDVSDRALVSLSGPDAPDLLHRISTNDLAHLAVGASAQTILTNEKGRIVEVLSVCRTIDDEILLAGSSNDDKELTRWLNKFIIMEDARVTSVKALYNQIIVISDKALADNALGQINEKSTYVINEDWGETKWTRLILSKEQGSPDRILDIGMRKMSVKDFSEFRLRGLVPIYPNEINFSVNPLEIGLRHLVDFKKGCYVGQEVIARLDTYDKVQGRLCGFRLTGLPRSVPAPIFQNGTEAGILTSSESSSSGESILGLGILKRTAQNKMFYLNEQNISLEIS